MTFAAETNATRQQSRLGGQRRWTMRLQWRLGGRTDAERHNIFSARLSGGEGNECSLVKHKINKMLIVAFGYDEANLICLFFLDSLQQIILLTQQFLQWNETVTRLEAAAKPLPSVD